MLRSCGLFPDERMLQRNQTHNRVTLHRSIHPKWEQDQTEKSSYGLDWQQKGMWHGSAKVDNKLLQNVQNITWIHKPYRGNHENLENGIDSRKKKLTWNKDPKRYFLRRCSLTFIIHNCHDVTLPHTQKIHSQIRTQQIAGKDQSSNVHGWYQTICK